MRKGDTSTFNSSTYEKTAEEMRSRGEKVHDRAQQVFRETGQLDPLVNIFGKRRTSRNAFQENPDGTCTLTHGIKLPIFSGGDGTASMGEYLSLTFMSMKELFGMFSALDRYQIDLSIGVLQDVDDEHAVFQMAEFESDNRAADHVRLLFPDKHGGDTPEDYDLGLYYLDQAVDTDIHFYGLKGYLFITADSDGRGSVSPSDVKRHLGLDMQMIQSTKNICQRLLEKWHFYLIQVKNNDECTTWWTDKVGSSRVIRIDDGHLLDEVQSGLIYVTETLQPNRQGLEEFLRAGNTNQRISSYDIDRIWGWLQTARIHFGAQAKLPGFDSIPKPGDIFAHYRDPWPIGHPRAGENPSATGKTSTPSTPPTPSPDPIPWDKL